jgi:D-alanyl-D-alanine carboxypeptidase/D-alanyl-D-alanine-endopeptidase (penicillin-binding protein 4)
VQQSLTHQTLAESLSRDSSLRNAHIGVSVYDPAERKYLISYQDDKYFVPASNTKLFSLYAGLKFLGDSLPGIRYVESDSEIFLIPTGDPSLLHPDFSRQPVVDFLKSTKKKIYITDRHWKDEAWGSGWSWDDYNDDYMPERNALPVYGNLIRWLQAKQEQKRKPMNLESSFSIYSVPEINWKVRFNADSSRRNFFVKRRIDDNYFEIYQGDENFREQDVPFITHGVSSAIELLRDTVSDRIFFLDSAEKPGLFAKFNSLQSGQKLIRSQPVDSLFKIMMFRSDNFFAEQTLLMAADEYLGTMSDLRMIDTLLKTDLNGLPEIPNWADGSGLSRYNLFSPRDVYLK